MAKKSTAAAPKAAKPKAPKAAKPAQAEVKAPAAANTGAALTDAPKPEKKAKKAKKACICLTRPNRGRKIQHDVIVNGARHQLPVGVEIEVEADVLEVLTASNVPFTLVSGAVGGAADEGSSAASE